MAVQGPVVAGVIRQGVVDSISNVSWNQRAGGALLGVPTDDVGLLRDPTRDVDVLIARPKHTFLFVIPANQNENKCRRSCQSNFLRCPERGLAMGG